MDESDAVDSDTRNTDEVNTNEVNSETQNSNAANSETPSSSSPDLGPESENALNSDTQCPSIRSNWIQMNCRFEQMSLKPSLLKVILQEFKKPLPLQCKTIAPCCMGRDILIAALPNTGKTCTAIISVLNTINYSVRQCQVVFLVDSVSNAEKLMSVIMKVGQKNLRCRIYDNTNNEVADENKCLTEDVQIIIGTPKSLLTLFSVKSYVKTYKIRSIVIDEADSLLSSDDMDSVSLLQEYINWTAQVIVICSVLSEKILEFVDENMADPIKIIVNTVEELALLEDEVKLLQNEETIDVNDVPEAPTPTVMDVDAVAPHEIGTLPKATVNSVSAPIEEDEFDLTAKLMAVKLRNLPEVNRIKITKFLNLALFDMLPKYCDLDKLIANKLPESKKSQCTQTDDCDFYNKEFDLCKKKLVPAHLLSQTFCSNVTRVTSVKWIRYFEDAPLNRQVKKGIMFDFKTPLFLQQKTLKLLLSGYDMLIQSPGDTGKTTAVIITALNMINVDIKECQAIIVFPSLESVYKIQENLNNISQFVQNVKCHPVCNLDELKYYSSSGAHMIVTVPEFLTSINLNTTHLKLFAIEEGNEIFLESTSLAQFASNLSEKVQIIITSRQTENMMFVQSLTRHFLQVNVTPEDLLLRRVRQFCVYVKNEDRRYRKLVEALKKLENIFPILVFCNTIQEVIRLSNQFSEDGVVTAVSLTEKLNQRNFQEFIYKFKAKSKRILISCDYCANYIDIESIPVVINYVMPFKRENFIQRIDRSGRFKHKSDVVNFVTNEEKDLLRSIQETYDMDVREIVNFEDVDFESNTD